jgi:DHA2 family multidrug resistance protein
MSLFGGTFILPLFLSQVRGYSAAEVGSTMVISGSMMFLTGPIAGRIVRTIDPRVGIVGGFALAAYGVGLGAHVTANWGFWEFAWLQAIRAIGVMIAMIAAQSMTVSTLRPELMKDASAIVNLTRNVGGAIGLAILSTILAVQQRVHYTEISSRMGQANPQSQAMLQNFTALMTERGVADPVGAAHKGLSFLIHKDALVLAFGDAFFWLAAGSAVAGVLGIIAKPSAGMLQMQQQLRKESTH